MTTLFLSVDRWRHVKRGSEYDLLGIAQVQASTPIVEPQMVAVYRSVREGELWVRPADEFTDGRFEPVIEDPPAPAASVPAESVKALERNDSCCLNTDELVVGTEYDVTWDDDSSTEGAFRSVLVEKGRGVTRWANGVVLRGEPICYVVASGSLPYDYQYLLDRIKR